MTDECVLWPHAKNKAGYGVTWADNKWAYAHRVVACALPGQVVRHTCDNPSCVNPKHLVVGSHKENSQDMVNKRRQAYGERCPASKVSEEIVLEIRALHGLKPSRAVAKQYQMSKTNVLDIWNKKIWRYL